MSNDLATKAQGKLKTVQDLLLRSRPQIQMALPSHMTTDRMIRVALTTIRQTPKLLECDELSLIKAVMQASALGLEPDPILGRAYIVPYGREATLIIGYKGLIDLARRSGELKSLEAHVVYERDVFDYEYGLNERLVHRPAFDTETAERGKLTHAWALARLKDGCHQFEVMDFWALEKIRLKSPNGNGAIWKDHREEMYRKTVIRRLSKFLPLSPELARQLSAEDMIEAGMPPSEVFADDPAPTAGDAAAPATSRSTRLARQIAAEGPAADEVPSEVEETEAGTRG